MDKPTARALLDEYFRMLANHATATDEPDGSATIELPFTDSSGDLLRVNVQLYDNGLLMTDESQALTNLAFAGIDFNASPYAETIDEVARDYHVKLAGTADLELTIVATSVKSAPDCLHNLIGAVLRIDALRATAGWAK